MTTGDFNGLIDLIVLIFGGYILFTCIYMKKTGKIRGGMMLPKGVEPERCTDAPGYIRFILPRLAAVGVLALICGILGLCMDYLQAVHAAVYYTAMAVLMAALIWYTIAAKKAVRTYWKAG